VADHCLRAPRQATAALAAPFKPKDADLFSIISSFDAAYSAYNGYQAGMERFWTLKYMEQNGITELTATVIKEGPGGSFLVRADDIPLVFPVLGAQNLPRGARLKVRLGEVDEITLDIHGTVIERLDDPRRQRRCPVDEDEGDEDAVAGPIAIAVDVNEPTAPHPPTPIIRRREHPLAFPLLQHAADCPGRVGGRARGPPLGALHRPRGLQPRVPGHAAGSHPGQRQVHRAARQGPGHCPGQPGRAAAMPRKGRATSPLPYSALTAVGDDFERCSARWTPCRSSKPSCSRNCASSWLPCPSPTRASQSDSGEQMSQEEKRRQLLKLLAEIEKRINEENSRPKKRYISPATREEAYAVYYDALRRKVEDKGTENFPEQGGKKLYGELIMIVTVNHDGRVLSTEVVQGSGKPALDRRAEAIARAAAPFGRFTPEMRAKADQVAMVARFKFTREQTLETSVR
jgi:protein TonB